jgi:hypothetical protein
MIKALLQTLREVIEKKPWLRTAALGAFLFLLLAMLLPSLVPTWASESGPGDLPFFTTDDGVTRFVGEKDQIPPFTEDGKEAVQAMVFTCDAGKTTMVGFLMKYDESSAAAIKSAAKGARDGRTAGQIASKQSLGRLVKKPGSGEWLSMKDVDKYREVTSPKCPDGRDAEIVFGR